MGVSKEGLLDYAMNKAKTFKSKKEFLDYLASLLPKLDVEQAKIAAAYIEEEFVKESRVNYYQYVKLMGPVLMGEFVDGRHIEIISNKLQRAAERAMKKGTKRYKLKLNMPPGASKTQLCSRMFGSWVIGRWPWAKLLICTHGLVFGRDEIGMKMLDIMRTEEYKKIFPEVELREDKQTAGRFLTTDDGEMLITSLSAGTSGRRGHIILADDAVIESDALSKDIRAKRNSEYTTNIRTRFQPGFNCAEIVLGTQWAQGDLFDFVEEADKHSTDKWEVIKFPALLTEQASEAIRKKGDPDDVYLPGTSYWPEMYTTEQLENTRASMRNDMARWNALYMQSPTPETGAIFNAEDFRVWRDTIPPPVHTKLLVLDTAYTKGKQSDPSAYSLFGIFNRTEGGQTRPNIILLDANKGKWEFPELIRKIETLHARKRPEYIVIEKQASGLALIPELRNRGLPIVEWRTQKDKVARAHSVSPLVKSGIFWVPMPEGDDTTAQKSMDYISTICAMSSWDLLDTFTSGLMYMRDENLLLGDNYTTTEDEFYYEEDEDDGDTYGGSYTSALLM